MPQTNPKNGNSTREMFYYLIGYAGFPRSAGAGGNNNCLGLKGFYLIDANFIITKNIYLLGQFPETLH